MWREHFDGYQVPDDIISHPDLTDVSSKAGTCPAFVLTTDADRFGRQPVPVLWVEHSDPDDRYTSTPRFVVTGSCGNEAVLFAHETDDVGAIAALLAAER